MTYLAENSMLYVTMKFEKMQYDIRNISIYFDAEIKKDKMFKINSLCISNEIVFSSKLIRECFY